MADNRAPACVQALDDADRCWPTRRRESDGIMGDSAHQARKSDHNLGNAVDITHDPVSGCTGDIIATYALRDSRTTYVIWNRRINSRDGRGWRRYTGTNPHTHHCHISVHASQRSDRRRWGWVDGRRDDIELFLAEVQFALAPDFSGKPPYPGAPIELGSRGPTVRAIQEQLRRRGWKVASDGSFGPQTRKAVMQLQKWRDLNPDGVVDGNTWFHLWVVDADIPQCSRVELPHD